MSLLPTATLLFALLIAFGAVGLVRSQPSAPVPDTVPSAPPAGAASEPESPVPAMTRLKKVLRARDWRRALPSLLIVVGLLGVMLFGSLSLIFVLGQRAAGVASLAVLLFTLGRLAYDYRRA